MLNMNSTAYEATKAVVVILFAVLVLIFFPLLVIWAATQLFPVLAIPYTFYNWAAVVILGIFFRGLKVSKKD